MSMDRPNTAKLANLPESDELSLCDSKLDFEALIDKRIWAKYHRFSIEKIDPDKTCTYKQLVIATDKLLKAIGANDHFNIFTLTRMRFSSARLKSLLAGTRAEDMSFGRCPIDAAMLKDVCQKQGLKRVCIYDQFYSFAQVKNAVGGAPSLKHLVLSRPLVKPELVRAVRESDSDYKDPSIHWTDGEIAAIKKMGIDLKFKDTEYIFLPAFDDWHDIQDTMDSSSGLEDRKAREMSP